MKCAFLLLLFDDNESDDYSLESLKWISKLALFSKDTIYICNYELITKMDMEVNFGKCLCKRKRNDIEPQYTRQIGLVRDKKLLFESSKLPKVAERGFVVHKLIEAYDLLRNVTVYKTEPATESDLCNFHSSDYVEYLQSIDEIYTPEDEVELDHGLGYDCPPLDGLFEYCKWIAGGTLTAAKALVNRDVDVAINWTGGWHHAQRYEAEGLCYVNDVVLGILQLRSCFNRILYIDLDVHHGNGVEDCFEMSDKVFTLSLHKFEAGFYPGTGSLADIGSSKGRYHTVNVPLREGIVDKNYCMIFDRVFNAINRVFFADAIVLQCGADGLSGDPLGGFNLTEVAYGHCVNKVLSLNKPALILGGGGYNIANTSRCWAYVTSVIIGCQLTVDIPEHENFTLYGPSFELPITTSNRKDMNTTEYVNLILTAIEANLRRI